VSLDITGLRSLLDSLLLHLRAERKSAQTVKTYGDGVRAFLAWCQRRTSHPLWTGQRWTSSQRHCSTPALRPPPPAPASLPSAGSLRG